MRKLLKHDFKALLRVIIPINIIILASAIVGCLSLTVLFNMDNGQETYSSFFNLVRELTTIGAYLTLMAVLIALSAAFFATLIVICVRYYKNMITDEAYLTFTLPRSTGKIFASKFITGYVGMIITSVFTSIGYAMVGYTFLLNIARESGTNLHQVFKDITEFLNNTVKMLIEDEHFDVHPSLFIIVGIILVIVMTAKQLLLPYTCMNIGGCIAKKYKLLCAVGVYFGFTFISSIIYNVLNFVSMNLVYGFDDFRVSFFFTLLVIYTLLELVITALLWIISAAILKKKLNLQ